HAARLRRNRGHRRWSGRGEGRPHTAAGRRRHVRAAVQRPGRRLSVSPGATMSTWLTISVVAVPIAMAVVMAGAVASVRWRRIIARVEGDSMEPTLRAGDQLLLRRGVAELRTGCVVVFEQPF